MRNPTLVPLAIIAFLGMFATVSAADDAVTDTPSFRNDVMAVLSKAGCNQGTCHGNARGKGGFQLSLRGQDPDSDYEVLTREWITRRTNPHQPAQSLLLLKPTMQVPHEGGRRFAPDSEEYDILRRWIAANMPKDGPTARRLERLTVAPESQIVMEPADSVSLAVTAHYNDGRSRDIRNLAVYEPAQPIVEISREGIVRRLAFGETTVIVRYLDRQVPVRLTFLPARETPADPYPTPNNYIDEHVFAKLKSLRVYPSALCDDSTFVRRVTLDLLGVLPTADEARAFVRDESPDKRARLVDALLDRPEFADWWALKWSDALRNEEKTLDRKGNENFHAWLRNQVAADAPVNEMVRQIVASRGSTYEVPAANYYRALRDPQSRAESTAQLFLGVRLQCARCHNHPFDRWTQDDYYAWSNLFARVDYKILENRRRDTNDSHEFDGEQIVFMKKKGDVDDPRTGRPREPRVLDAAVPAVTPKQDRLIELAKWMTGPKNQRFAEVQANRIWQQLTGRGLVDPVDDFRASNPPSHPELLAALTDDFRDHGYRLKHLVRTIVASRTYQLSARPNETNDGDDGQFSRAIVQRLTAEQLLDGIAAVCGTQPKFSGYPAGIRAAQMPGAQSMLRRTGGPTDEDRYLKLFGKPPRLQACDCERTTETTLNQTFQMISGPLLQEWLSDRENALGDARFDEEHLDESVETLFWSALSRGPNSAELSAAKKFVAAASDRRQGVEDLLWSILNSHEFLLRH